MENKKQFIVLDPRKVFIIESDTGKLLSEGDFIIPPTGYHSVIEQIQSISYIRENYPILMKILNIQPEYAFDFLLLIYQESPKYISVYEVLDNRHDYRVSFNSISHNILYDYLNAYYENPVEKHEVHKHNIPISKLKYDLDQVDEIKITIDLNFLAKRLKVIITYDKHYYGSYIRSKGQEKLDEYYILGIELLRFIKKVLGDRIENSYINDPLYIRFPYQLKERRIDNIFLPNYVFFYFYDAGDDDYKIYEHIYGLDDYGAQIVKTRHNIFQSYLDQDFNPPVAEIKRLVSIPKDVFETSIQYIDRFENTLYYMHKNSYLKKETYYFPKNIYYSNIDCKGLLTKYKYLFNDTAYNPNVKNLRIFDGNAHKVPGIANGSIDDPVYILKSGQIFGPRSYDVLIPSR